MAILEGPLFGDEAKGKIKKTVTFFKRGEWFHFLQMLSFKQRESSARQARKDLFSEAVSAWKELTVEGKAEYGEYSTGLQTAFNTFLHYYLLGIPLPEAVTWSDTVEEETNFGISANAGTAETASRGDHTHGTPGVPQVGGSNILIFTFFNLSVTQGTWAIFAHASYWSGWGTYNSSNAQNDMVNFKVFLNAGTYTFKLMHAKFNSGAIATILIDGVSVGTIDTYASATTYNNISAVTGITIASSGLKTLSIKLATRNGSSIGWYLNHGPITIFQTS